MHDLIYLIETWIDSKLVLNLKNRSNIFNLRLLYREVINQKLLMNCDPNLYIGEFNHELVKIRTKLAGSNLKKSQTTMFTLLLHRSITLCRIEFSNISVKYLNVNLQCQLPLRKYLTQNGTFKSTKYLCTYK